MNLRPFRNAPVYWRSSLVPDGDMVTAEYNDHAFAPHWHDAYTIACIEAGAERYAYRGTELVADTGSMAIVHPGEVHTGARATDFGWRYRVFYLPPEYVRDVQAQLLAATTGGRVAADENPWFGDDVLYDAATHSRLLLAHRRLEAGDDPLAAEHALIDAVTMLLARHGQAHMPTLTMPRDTLRVEMMKARLAADLTEPLTLTTLAQAVDLSPFHAARLFARATGLAPHAWRNQLRLARALPSLRGGASATDVAVEFGFTDLSHFTRHFRKTFGVSPGRWGASSNP